MKKAAAETLLVLLLIGSLAFGFAIRAGKASGTVYIRADGSVDPDTAPISSVDNITYTLTNSIYDKIVVERDNIIVDGVGFAVQGAGSGTGIDLSERNNVTIKNIHIQAFDYGIWLDSSSNNSIHGNHVTTNPSNYAGVWLYNSSNNNIYNNNMTQNYDGIYLEASSYNSIHGNNLTANFRGIMISSMFGVSSYNHIYGNNIVDDYHGIRLQYSSYNSISQNYVTNSYFGIWLYWSPNNTISRNDIVANDYDGIKIDKSPGNSIWGNHITNNYNGIEIASTRAGHESSYNSLYRNNIEGNSYYGIWLYWSLNNSIYQNNVVDNSVQVNSYNSESSWDNGCEGNYWSDYGGIDADGDGIGDTPHTVDANNQDNYPLMSPYMVGDVNHDGTVDTNDLILVENAYGTEPGDSNWNCHCDVAGTEENPDGLVDVYDVYAVGRNFGKSTP